MLFMCIFISKVPFGKQQKLIHNKGKDKKYICIFALQTYINGVYVYAIMFFFNKQQNVFL